MKAEEIKIGHWYMIESYGFSRFIKGKVVDVTGQHVTIKFYWGHIVRTRHVVLSNEIIGECRRPYFFSNY